MFIEIEIVKQMDLDTNEPKPKPVKPVKPKPVKQPKERLKADKVFDKSDVDIVELPLRDVEAYNSLVQKVICEADKITVPNLGRWNRAPKLGLVGRTMTFGYGLKVWHKPGPFKYNAKHPELFDALISFGNFVAPDGWAYDAITLNKNMVAEKHTDSKNTGRSVIVGFGPYDDGFLRIWTDDASIDKDIKDRPLMFNGSLLPHAGLPFSGTRYSIVLHKQNVNVERGRQLVGGSVNSLASAVAPTLAAHDTSDI